MPDKDLIRPIEGNHLDDRVVYKIIDNETSESLGNFHHDGTIERPMSGETISLVTSNFDAENDDYQTQTESDEFRVIDVSHRWELIIIDKKDEEKSYQMMDLLVISVEPIS